MDNRELWLAMVGQVMVVGSSAGYNRFMGRPDLQEKIEYQSLKDLHDDELQLTINEVLRDAGVRYASKNVNTCGKTSALVHNYKILKNFKGGFKGLLKHLSEIKGKNAELERVDYLMQHFKFIKNKSARDFLMERGINWHTLALDVRIQNTFQHFGIEFPTQNQLARKFIYNFIEADIIKKVCEPLGIEPMKFDRILYQNYDEIIGKNKRKGKSVFESLAFSDK
ncbi:MAG: hypothetical protein ICV84_04410 [Flavisolibacter sp.]|nr:hypothetical protein [Flavisolibacter sp.]